MARTNNALRTVFNAVKRFGGLNLILMQSTFTTVLTLFLIWAPPRELPGLHNVHQAATNVYLGSEPHGEEAFAELQKLGVTTIVSVDGAQPDVAAASKFGIRYVHIPIGYDGIGTDAAKSLTRVARDIESPIYVHCHHGKHRGPAATAVLCLAANSINHEQALALMTAAGTGKDYTGLWRDVKNFKPLPVDTKLPELVEVAKVESLAAAMAKLDRSFDNVKLLAKAEWNVPKDHPDLVPATEVRLVQEGLHESGRHLTSNYDEQFRTWLNESDAVAMELATAVHVGDRTRSSERFKTLEQKCVECHQTYRNQ